jgi:hypothetical protein
MPPKLDKPPRGVVADDQRGTKAGLVHTIDDKLRALRQYHRARGLCDKCTEKWVLGHQCATSVQLIGIHEKWDLFSDDDCQSDDLSCAGHSDPPAQLNMMVSVALCKVLNLLGP